MKLIPIKDMEVAVTPQNVIEGTIPKLLSSINSILYDGEKKATDNYEEKSKMISLATEFVGEISLDLFRQEISTESVVSFNNTTPAYIEIGSKLFNMYYNMYYMSTDPYLRMMRNDMGQNVIVIVEYLLNRNIKLLIRDRIAKLHWERVRDVIIYPKEKAMFFKELNIDIDVIMDVNKPLPDKIIYRSNVEKVYSDIMNRINHILYPDML